MESGIDSLPNKITLTKSHSPRRCHERDALAARNENMARAFSPHLGGARGLALRARLV